MSAGARVRIGADHWLEGAVRCQSPNCDARPDPDDIALLVIHNISLPPGSFGGDEVRQLFTNCLDCSADPALNDLAGVRVSAHLFVDRRGAMTQFVPSDQRAWHAGSSSYRGRARCNDYSIGIELEGTDRIAYEDPQYGALSQVVVTLIRRYSRLSLDAVVGHQEVAPGRKSDPGPAFDWPRFYRECYRRLGSSSRGSNRR
jgi:N-acetyl-anhydromuramoyl-L-alanine amidase